MRWFTNLLADWRAARAQARAEREARLKAAKRFAIHIASSTEHLHLRKGAL